MYEEWYWNCATITINNHSKCQQMLPWSVSILISFFFFSSLHLFSNKRCHIIFTIQVLPFVLFLCDFLWLQFGCKCKFRTILSCFVSSPYPSDNFHKFISTQFDTVCDTFISNHLSPSLSFPFSSMLQNSFCLRLVWQHENSQISSVSPTQ